MDDLLKLRAKLCRELTQSERSADVQTRREARRLGNIPPAHAIHALGEHARSCRNRFEALAGERQPRLGITIARAMGQAFSLARSYFLDLLIDVERSYRGTLLGFHHGVDTARLLAEVAVRIPDARLAEFLADWLPKRLVLVERAERALSWFAETPRRALRSGARTVGAVPR